MYAREEKDNNLKLGMIISRTDPETVFSALTV
jgi:hypothetical protein